MIVVNVVRSVEKETYPRLKEDFDIFRMVVGRIGRCQRRQELVCRHVGVGVVVVEAIRRRDVGDK